MNHKQTILAVFLVAQVVLLVILRGPFSSQAAASTVQPFLPELDGLVATRVAIESGDGETVSLSLEDDAWTLDDMDGFPVDGGKVDTLIQDLRRLKVRRPVVTSSRFHDQLMVGDSEFERHVRIWGDVEGDPAVDFLVGASPNYRVSDVRRGGQDDVYEVMGLSSWDLQSDVGSWIDKKLVDVPADEVTGLKVVNGNGTFELKKEDGTWTVLTGSPGGELDQGAVDSLVRAYASLYLADPVGKIDAAAQGLDQPVAEIHLIRPGKPLPVDSPADPDSPPGEELGPDPDSPPGEEPGPDPDSPPGEEPGPDADSPSGEEPVAEPQVTTLQVGKEMDDESGKRYATVSGFGFAVTLNKFDAERATDKKLADLIEDVSQEE
ncbi:MAG: DUF4340 domain-containing protein [Acidobacteria bacterium]|nr:MAG: DUF4340 domain-containing protein [Acidobacteriota bacterium]TDI42544.1 MAG: DUF4340 domain-containing protein [Acidobacteriota bacterium]